MGGGALRGTSYQIWTARWVSSHPDGDLYLAFRWRDDTFDNEWTPGIGPGRVDGISVYFDDDGDGVQRLGEDAKTLLAVDQSSWYVDQHTSADFASDQVGDGIGRIRYDHGSRHYTAELLIPAADDRLQQDGTKTRRTRFAVLLWDAA